VTDLDFRTGVVSFSESEFSIGPSVCRSEFLSSHLASNATPMVQHERYHSYSIGRHELRGRAFAISIFFESESLYSIHFSPVDPNVSSLAALTPEKLGEMQTSNESWLLREFGIETPASFAWGTVETTVDLKTLNAPIVWSFFQGG